MRTRAALLATAIAIALSASATLTAAPALAATTTVQVGGSGLAFTDQNITVTEGDSVHWTWAGSNHSVTSGNPPGTPDGAYDSGVQLAGATFDRTFATPGVYHYYCKIHYLEGMVGTVTVLPSRR